MARILIDVPEATAEAINESLENMDGMATITIGEDEYDCDVVSVD